MNICARCVLPETFPGVQFHAGNICSFCHDFERRRARRGDERRRTEQKFSDLIGRLDRPGRSESPPYDAIAAFSGGKGSTFMLLALKRQYSLNVLAVTLDHGFFSPQARENIGHVTEALAVDHIVLSPNRRALFHAFRESASLHLYPSKALERASSVCHTCMHLVKSSLLRMAMEMEIPLLAFGGSPGQMPIQSSVTKLNASLVREEQAVLMNTLWKIMGRDLTPFLLRKRHYAVLDREQKGDGGLSVHAVYPLAFQEYREDHLLKEIEHLGWKPPGDTDANSTNCLLNAYANQVHQEKYGFHPYTFEVAGLVRDGCISRDAGLAKLAKPLDHAVVSEIKKRLSSDAVGRRDHERARRCA